MENSEQKSGYGRRPLWQWIVVYVIIGVIVYGVIYYFVFAKKGGYNDSSSTSDQQYTQNTNTATQSPAGQAGSVDNGLVMTKADASKGNYLTDTKGMTLYIFDKDVPNKSNCSDSCLEKWLPFSASLSSQTLPANMGIISGTSGSMQYTWKEMPLYYYVLDKQTGDINGDGVGGVWHIVKP